MKLPSSIWTWTALLLLCSLPSTPRSADAIDLEIDRFSKGVPLIPISLTGFSGDVQKVLTFDLEVAGFKIVSEEAAQYNLVGSNAGDVQGQLTDRVTKSVLLAKRYSGGSPRVQAHALSDDIVLKITGKPGIARTQIAFKGESGKRSEIYIADYDGANAKAATSDGALVTAPSWVPGGKRMLYYTSYRSGWPDIYSHDLATGERRIIARYPGSNISPAASPGGGRVAMILSKDGNPELYVSNADGTNLKRLTKTPDADESSPSWSPDGSTICFVRRTGLPSLYLISAEGGEPRRLRTADAGRVTEPDWSPDGKWIAFTVQRGGFEICVVPAQGGDAITLTTGEDPSWAPNSRTIAFTRSISGRKVLSLLDVPTKRVKDVAQSLGGCSQPSWAR